ncbi:MAG TPA: hypothetical protein VM434_07600 [Beijerinckiaceae bacterium]|nr:hypothetical protein [Beijerinckiaceae bacterium]
MHPALSGPLEAGRPWTSRETRLALAAVLVFWTLAALAWPATGSVVPWDSKNHFYPMLRYLGAALASGELPLWNPFHFSGHPAVADPQSLLFTPTMLLFGWLVPSPSMQLFDAVVFTHLLPGGLALVALFRSRGWGWPGAVIAAMVFILGGSASARLQHTGMIFSYGYFPVALWLLEEALERRSYGFAVAFATVAALMTVGRDQVAFLFGLILMGRALHRILGAERPLAFLKERVGILAVMGVIGAALLAVPALLTMQFLSTSTRPSFGFGVAAMGSLPPDSLATILFGNIFGSLRLTYDYWGPDWHSLAEGTWTDRATNYLFAGTVPAALILWHGIAGRRLFAREFRFFLVVGAIAVVYALGRYTPLFELAFDHLPGVDLYRRPADATFLINVVLAFAAGYLVHRYLAEGMPRLGGGALGRLAAGAALACLAAAAFAGFRFAVVAREAKDAVPSVAFEVALGLAVAAGLFLLLRAAGSRARLAAACVAVAFTGGELIARNAASALNAEPPERYAVFRELPPEQLQGLRILETELAARHAKGERPRVEILGLAGAWQNAGMVLGLEGTIGYNPLRLADYERAVGPGENAVDLNLRHFPSTFRGYRCRLASLLGLEYLVLGRPIEKLPRHFPSLAGAKLLYGSGSMWVYRLNPTAPRAYVARRVIPVESEEVLKEGELPDFDRTDEVLVDVADLPSLAASFAERDPAVDAAPASGTVSIASYRRNEVTLAVETDRPAVIVLHDIHYPGWQAYVDGEHRPLLRANLLFRGVEVPAGAHKVEFRFEPLSLRNLVAAAAQLMRPHEGEDDTVVR